MPESGVQATRPVRSNSTFTSSRSRLDASAASRVRLCDTRPIRRPRLLGSLRFDTKVRLMAWRRAARTATQAASGIYLLPISEELAMPTTSVNGVELYWELNGDNGAPVALVHGSWGDHDNWASVVTTLSRSFRVCCHELHSTHRCSGTFVRELREPVSPAPPARGVRVPATSSSPPGCPHSGRREFPPLGSQMR
jgi:hypothetical protein